MRTLLYAALAALFAVPAWAAVEYDEATSSLKIFGETSPWTTAQALKVLAENEVGTVYMAGPGGHLYEAFKLGRAIAAEGARVIIPAGKDCVSACAFAALAADEIHVDGRLLLHRPFFMAVPVNEDLDSISGHFGIGYLDLAAYLAEHGYPISVTTQIVRGTRYCKFIVVDDAAKLEEAKTAGYFSVPKLEDNCRA